VIRASTPVRVCDLGGWTDTWFGGPGRVLNIAVQPGIEVSIRAHAGPEPVVLDVASYGDRYAVMPGEARTPRHPLLEAAVDALPPPAGAAVEVAISSEVPSGCGAGTSAAVTVALLGALAALRDDQLTPRQVAYAAHALEVEVVGRQSGIQDHLSAALGGTTFLTIDDYPAAAFEPLPTWERLNALLTTVYVGQDHVSDHIHRAVIDRAATDKEHVFARLRAAAEAGRQAWCSEDLEGFGMAMIANTDAQSALHDALVGRDAARVIETAAAWGAIGWKVNGAGGDGGSLTLLSREPSAKTALEEAIGRLDGRFQVLPLHVSPLGLTVRRD
jgi:D-glycero-alpha-D-manno-heptose-7-phosphate kinase